KFILLFRKGSKIDLKQLAQYKDKEINELYVYKDDYSAMTKKQVFIAGMIIDSDKVDEQAKLSIMNRVASGIYDGFTQMGLGGEAFDSAKVISESVVTLVQQKTSINALLEGLNKVSEEIFRHSMGVSFISPMIGVALGWTRSETLEKLSLGGLLHDIGKRELSPEILKKSRGELTYDEVKEYENHPHRSVQLLSTIEGLPADITAIAYEHHENSIGQGFPKRLWDMKLNPLSRVVALANTFCELTMGSATYPQKKSAEDALNHIETIL
ncbi:MAG: HD domain-containing protein, partial [Bdellovibrionales bacterium]|nr:HD domain-containing protein [Bdellovibrionales bacterium]